MEERERGRVGESACARGGVSEGRERKWGVSFIAEDEAMVSLPNNEEQ